MNRMLVFYLISFLILFVVIPGAVYLVPWAVSKLLGLFLPRAAAIGKWTGAILSLSLIAVFLFGFLVGWRTVRVRHIDLGFDDLPESFEGYKLVQFSDWHLGTYSRNHATIEREVRKALDEKPDLIVFTGDIVNIDPEELRPFMETLSQLKAPDGVWSIMGNHDYCTYNPVHDSVSVAGYVREIHRMETEMGWNLMLNSNHVISHGMDSIALLGVENDGQPPFPRKGDLRKAQEGLPEGMFKILLSHDSTHWRRSVLPETDIQLTLSGHTHAMQFRIGKLSPSMLYYKEWGGLYKEGDRKLYVSTGSGGNIPFRFGAWPEVDVITLHRNR